MIKGDISNSEAPRSVFVFEYNIGYLADAVTTAKEKALCGARRWRRAVDCWDIPERATALLWDLTWRYDQRFDIVTFKGEKFAGFLYDRLEGTVPFANLWSETPEKFAQRLAFMPYVSTVYDSDPQRQLTYGTRGVIIPGGLAAVNSLW
jgi:hypothetical protein